MNISVTLSNITNPDENHDSLLAVVEAANVPIRAENTRRAALTPPEPAQAEFTAQTYLESLLNKAVQSYSAQRYEAALKRLGTAAAQLPYADRLALINQVEQQVSGGE
jgi:hypothetical protein